MQTKQLGQSDLFISRVGLGTWAIGGSGWRYGWGAQDDEDSIRTIRHALELGINWIDTAPVYGLGHSEEVVGRALQGLKEKPLVATKCGRTWTSPMTLGGNLKKPAIKGEAEDSLRRLGLERIDLLQIHWPDPDKDLEEAWEAIGELMHEGKVRYGGVSNCNIAQLERIGKLHPVTSLQPPYSMLKRDGEVKLFPYCQEHGIGIIGYSPMHKGLLSGKFSRERVSALPADDHRRDDVRFKEPALSVNLAFIGKLQALAAGYGLTMAQLAVAWTLRGDEVTAAIVGGRHPEQLDEIARAGDLVLEPALLTAVEELLAEWAQTAKG